MTDPVVFISHFRVKEGRLDDYRRLAGEVTPQLEDEKPATLVFLSYVDEADRRLTIVHAFGDQAAMDRHFEGATERSGRAMQFLEPEGWEIYGTPSAEALGMMRQMAASAGVSLKLRPTYIGGFLRSR